MFLTDAPVTARHSVFVLYSLQRVQETLCTALRSLRLLMKKILVIAASDSGGGAGIQADVKAITLCGCFAMTAITALTAQNTRTVTAVFPLPVEFIEQQIDTVMQDISADAIKTGMLFSADIVRTVARKIQEHRVAAVVVDPVMRAKGGATLLQQPAIEAVIEYLFPLALVVTPNLDEAALLCGFSVDSPEAMKAAARKIKEMGPQNVVIKGGHLAGDCIDLFYDGEGFTEFAAPRIDTINTHGTGCTFASALAAKIALGFPPQAAVKLAKEFIQDAIRHSFSLGKGHGPTDPFAGIARSAGLWESAAALQEAFHKLQNARIGHLIPDVQSNLGYALENAAAEEDVVAFPGRIVRLHDSIAAASGPLPGASRHIAKIILTLLRYDRQYRSAMNIRYSSDTIERCRARGLRVAEFNRREEPRGEKEAEISTLEWGTNLVLSQSKTIPDIIFDTGDAGKEPMIRVLGTTPMDVADKIIKLAR
jgi:hydroxymethylpyrimidine kinase / phosphomethylpyrimidine kinase / thiamine-phosphate diphosphorylase